MGSALEIRDNADEKCYEAVVDDKVVGSVVYNRRGERVVILHTVVEPEFRGSGFGTKMVRGVLDDVRERGETLTTYCGFVADFLADNDDYQDLIDSSRPGVYSPRGKHSEAAIDQ